MYLMSRFLAFFLASTMSLSGMSEISASSLGVLAPGRDIFVVELLELRAGPTEMVHAVCDVPDIETGKHQPGYFPVKLAHSVGGSREIEGQNGGVQKIVSRKFLDIWRAGILRSASRPGCK